MSQGLEDPGAYGWHPANTDPGEIRVPSDLVHYYLEFRPGYYGYVCPACKCVFAPGWSEKTPAEFKAHIKPALDGKGCFFAQKKGFGQEERVT